MLVGSPTFFSQVLLENTWRAVAFGQTQLSNTRAHIEWVLPLKGAGDHSLIMLIDNLCMESGLRGSKLATASASQDTMFFEILRRCGFIPYDWHAFWIINKIYRKKSKFIWSKPSIEDMTAVLSFQNHHLPLTVRAVLQPGLQNLPNYILRMDGELLGYIELVIGRGKMVVTPFISSSADNPLDLIASFVSRFLENYEQVYIRQTGAMAWLSSHLKPKAVPVLERQELLVKHFTVRNIVRSAEINATANSRHADPAVPFARSSNSQENV